MLMNDDQLIDKVASLLLLTRVLVLRARLYNAQVNVPVGYRE